MFLVAGLFDRISVHSRASKMLHTLTLSLRSHANALSRSVEYVVLGGVGRGGKTQKRVRQFDDVAVSQSNRSIRRKKKITKRSSHASHITYVLVGN